MTRNHRSMRRIIRFISASHDRHGDWHENRLGITEPGLRTLKTHDHRDTRLPVPVPATALPPGTASADQCHHRVTVSPHVT